MSLLSFEKTPGAGSLVGILLGSGTGVPATSVALAANQLLVRDAGGYTAKSISTLAQLLLADSTAAAMRSRLGVELASGKVLVGNVSGAATPVTLTGDVTVSASGVTAIGAGKIVNALLADMAANTIKARAASTLGTPGDLALTANTFPVRKSTGDLFAGTISDWMVDSFLFNNTAGTALGALGVTAYAQTLLDDANALAARTTLGFSSIVHPAFFVHRNNVDQSTAGAGVDTKIQFTTEVFDTNSNFDNAVNYRFTPTVEGYYQLNLTGLLVNHESGTQSGVRIYKNGGLLVSALTNGAAGLPPASTVSAVVYANGSTDYFEGYIYNGNTSAYDVSGHAGYTTFSGVRVS